MKERKVYICVRKKVNKLAARKQKGREQKEADIGCLGIKEVYQGEETFKGRKEYTKILLRFTVGVLC